MSGAEYSPLTWREDAFLKQSLQVEKQRDDALKALRELHAAGVELAPLVGYVNASISVRWDDAMSAAFYVLEASDGA